MLLLADWVLPITSKPIKNGAVLVKDKIIAEVSKADKLKKRFPHEEKKDFKQAILMPGLVNLHTHLDYTVMRGYLDHLSFFPWIMKLTKTKYEKMSQDDCLTSALWGTIEAIESGVTTVADTTDVSTSFYAVRDSGLRGIIYQELFGLDDAEASKALDETIKKIKNLESQKNDQVTVGISPHTPYTVGKKLFQIVTQTAKDRNYPMCIHIAETKDENQLLQKGKGKIAQYFKLKRIKWSSPHLSPIKYLESLGVLEKRPLLVHSVFVDDDDISILRKNKVAIAHCPKSNAKFGHGVSPLIKFLKNKIRVGLGTDGMGSNNIMDMFEEARFALMLQKAINQRFDILDAEKLIRLMTIEGAKTLNLDDKIGSLEKGKSADIIAVDISRTHNLPTYDPYSTLIYCANATDVIFTIVDGKILYENGEVKTLNKQEIKEKIIKIANKLKKGVH